MNYQEELARWRMERRQQEQASRLEDIRREHAQAARERDEAIANNDLETAELRDNDCQYLENEWREIAPPPQTDPRLVEFARKNQAFLQRYGQRAYEALDAAHNYMMRRRNPNTNDPRQTGMGWKPQNVFTPQYFEKMKDLLELHGEQFLGVRYDRDEEALTANEACKISGLHPNQYNYAVRAMHAQGRLGQKK